MGHRVEITGIVDPQLLRYTGVIFAVIVASIHLTHVQYGFPRLVQHIMLGTIFDPRPLVFTITGSLIILGILLVFNGLYVRWVYLLGITLMLSYLIGFLAWHTVLEHGGFWPHIPAQPHQDVSVGQSVRIHLIKEPITLISKISEMILLLILVILYVEHD